MCIEDGASLFRSGENWLFHPIQSSSIMIVVHAEGYHAVKIDQLYTSSLTQTIAHALYMLRAKRGFAQFRDCPAQALDR